MPHPDNQFTVNFYFVMQLNANNQVGKFQSTVASSREYIFFKERSLFLKYIAQFENDF